MAQDLIIKSVSLPRELDDRFRLICFNRRLMMSHVIRDLLDGWLDEQETPES